MRIYIFIIGIIFVGLPAKACSYQVQTPFYAVSHLDVLFEGKVIAAYVNGIQISTEVLGSVLQSTNGPIDILLKITPTKIYFGSLPKTVQIKTNYNNNVNTCSDYFFNPKKDIWGATFLNGELISSSYDAVMAYYAQRLLDEANKYEAKLSILADSGKVPRASSHFVAQELSILTKLLAGENLNQQDHYSAADAEIAGLPYHVMEARLEYLNVGGLLEEAANTALVLASEE
ncbi:MAG: hypothetical protein JKY60_17345 [Kordiimonadaceae bacterium]|nr:hypothetical protein [Kordiimonadaceae bacterium]